MKPYYEHAGITIYHGDCREVMEQWEGLRTQSFDLLLTDPPYGMGIAADAVRHKYQKQGWDDVPCDLPTLMRCIAICRQSIIWGGNYFGLPAEQCFLVWDKKQPEDFSTAMVEQAWTRNINGPAKMYRFSVTTYAKSHPTEKPESLMRWCVGRASVNVKTVLDPFMGSGTTLVACKRLGRPCVGIEIEERYCEIAANRLSQEVLPLEVA